MNHSTESQIVIEAANYTSPAVLRQEGERLWPKVWHQACRQEEIPEVGDYLTYDFMDQSFIIVRTGPEELKAFYNSCPHRGRRLTTELTGRATGFICLYHGWKFNLDGSNREVVDRQDWGACLGSEDASLTPVRVDTWGGWVFINEDPDGESLREFLDPVPQFLDPFEIEKMRYRWYVTLEVPCNWKVALEAFNEAYHVQTTHRQILPFYDDVTTSKAHGRHAQFGDFRNDIAVGRPADRLGKRAPEDARALVLGFIRMLAQDVQAIYSERDLESAARVMTEMEPTADRLAIMSKVMEFNREAALASGAGWPDITPEQLFQAGSDWHIFPNMVVLPYCDASLWYRARPHPTDPDRCTFDIYSLQRYTEGAAPPLVRQYYKDWRDFKMLPSFLIDDFINMPEVQRGMHNRGFRGARPNPVKEVAVYNFHRVIRSYISDPDRADAGLEHFPPKCMPA
jgi:phenylpropionate dioxygenase-like ring-hydroxylating dioxygenase large terminal subunit